MLINFQEPNLISFIVIINNHSNSPKDNLIYIYTIEVFFLTIT